MADYCQQCSIKIHGRDHGDLARLCKPGETVCELCEGCGDWVEVDHLGRRVEVDKDGNAIGSTVHDLPVYGSRWRRVLRFLTGNRGSRL